MSTPTHMYVKRRGVVPFVQGTHTDTGVIRAVLRVRCTTCTWRIIMLHWSLVFLVFALIAAVLGFGGLAGAAVGIAKILFFVFLVIWLVAFLTGRRAI